MITHIVLFKFKDRSPAGIEIARAALAGMAGRIPELRHLEVGADVLHLDRSFDLALMARFDSLEDLNIYQYHPVHQEAIKEFAHIRDVVISVDYES